MPFIASAQPAGPPPGVAPPGDLPAATTLQIVAPSRAPPPDVPPPGLPAPPSAPITADSPRPSSDARNFEGTWRHDQGLITRMTRDMYGNPIPFTARAKRIIERRLRATYETGVPYSNASGECIPPGQPWQLEIPGPFQVYQSARELNLLFNEYHGVWRVRMDQPHRPPTERSYHGDSVARWDGNTLVVDTRGYQRPLWLDVDGDPASRNAHLLHRIRRFDDGTPKLEIITTVDDPEMYAAPWSFVRTFAWSPEDDVFQEYNCEYQVGSEGGVQRYGLIAEPDDDQH